MSKNITLVRTGPFMHMFKSAVLGLLLLQASRHGALAAITFPKLPKGCDKSAYEETISFYQRMPSLLPANVKTNDLKLMMGHKWYFIDYKTLPSSNILYSTSCSPGWNFMAIDGTNMFGVVELELDHENTWRFGGMISRQKPDPLWVGLKIAEELPLVKKQNYEFRFLSLSMDFQAIWLHAESDDMIIPLPPVYKGEEWTAYQPYSERQIADFLKHMVKTHFKN